MTLDSFVLLGVSQQVFMIPCSSKIEPNNVMHFRSRLDFMVYMYQQQTVHLDGFLYRIYLLQK